MAKTIALDVTTSQAGFTTLMGKVQSALIDRNFSSGGLTLGSSSKKALKLANTTYSLVDGVLIKKTTAEYALPTGQVANATFNVFVVVMNSSGTVSVLMGTAAATLGAVVFPTIPANSAVMGFAIVNPTGTGPFVNGTTDFDDATVVPNAVYVDITSAFNPNMLSL